MRSLILAAVAALVGTASAKTCRNVTVPVNISSRNGVFNIAIPQNNLDVTTFIQNQTQQGRNFTDTALTGYATVSGSYSLSAKFCAPDNMTSSANPTVQVLTHGIGFDKTYWDLPYNNYNYSYINTAVDTYGYCTVSYDRLGIGNSSHGEPLNEIQASLEVEALYALTSMLRNGTFPTVNHTFSKVVHVGHSFGSAQTYTLANMYPDASDAIVLTGFSVNSSFVGYFAAGALFQLASTNQPFRFGNITGSVLQATLETLLDQTIAAPDYFAGIDLATAIPAGQNLPNGYLLSANAQADQFNFLYPGNFDPMLAEFSEATKQPVTLGEILTLGSMSMSNQFQGPVLVQTGEHDLPYCGGNCLATGNPALASIPAGVKMAFPNVADANFTALIQPNTGHGLTVHYNATAGYVAVQTFLQGKGF